mgnify:FL=1
MKSILVGILLASPAVAQDVSFSISGTEACLAGAVGVERLVCIGVSANACMETTDGSSTVGMGFCLGRELGFWDARLNATYRTLRHVERDLMAEATKLELRVPDSEAALRDMQRSWMGFRDSVCAYEFSTWGGGSGGGPASAACLMELTAQQSLMLEDRLEARRR